MTYRAHPTNMGEINISQLNSSKNMPSNKRPTTLYYKVEGGALFAGPSAIRDTIASDAPYAKVAVAEGERVLSDLLSVKIEQVPPSVAANVFGYVSFATLTFLPFWSQNDGSILTFTQTRNGSVVRSKEYVINRGTFVWLAMAPFAWVNFMTPSEEQAFKACTKDFLQAA